MENRRFTAYALCLLWLLMAASGCGATKSVVNATNSAVKKFTPSSPGLKQRVLILPIVDNAGAGPEFTTRIHRELIENLKRSHNVVVYETTEPAPQPATDPEPQPGMVFPPESLQLGWDRGMNVLASVVLNAVNITTKRGSPLPLLPSWPSFLPFGETIQKYEASITANVGDVRCGVLIMSNVESEEKTLSVADAEAQDSGQTLRWLLEDTISDMVKRQSEEMLEALEDAAWYGRILSVEGETVRINGGMDVGVQPGMVFNVLAKGETLQCQDGRSLELLGSAMGRIKVTSVMEKEALTTPVDQGAFLAGMIVQPES